MRLALMNALPLWGRQATIPSPHATEDNFRRTWQRDPAVSHAKTADALKRMGNRAEALEALRRGHAIMLRLTALSPDNFGWKRDLDWFAAQIAKISW
jgi:hypothetical protein